MFLGFNSVMSISENRTEVGEMDVAEDSEEEDFDMSLPATHAYLSRSEPRGLRGRTVLEAGWRGTVPAAAHLGLVFPGQSVPLLLRDPEDRAAAAAALAARSLLCLLQPDGSGAELSGLGVLCDVLEARDTPDGDLALKARAVHRARLASPPLRRHVAHHLRLRPLRVEVLPERRPGHALRALRQEGGAASRERAAALTPWPRFVYEIYSYSRAAAVVRRYFRDLGIERLPEDEMSLSYFAAANMSLPSWLRRRLFASGCARWRLSRAAAAADRAGGWACPCGRAVAAAGQARAMSREGLAQHYTNPGGFLHDVLTVRAATNVLAEGPPSSEFSWFPGYCWTVLGCAGCRAHLGWRFDAEKKNLRPQMFYGLCRNNLVLQGGGEEEEEEEL